MLDPSDLRDLADLIWSPDITPPKPPNNFYLVWSCLMEISEGLRNSAARREAEAKELGQTRSPQEVAACGPIVEREGLDSADAELVKHLRMLAGIRAIPGPGSLGVEGDPAWKAADRIDTLKARVAELEKERGNIHASYEAERRMHHAAGDKLARLSAALKRIGKTYGANYARLIHSETQIKEIVEAALAEAGHGK